MNYISDACFVQTRGCRAFLTSVVYEDADLSIRLLPGPEKKGNLKLTAIEVQGPSDFGTKALFRTCPI